MKSNSTQIHHDLSSFGKALSDTSRQQIMQLCCCDWRNVKELVDLTGLAQSTVSHHLAVLSEAGLVHTRQEGKKVFYQLNQGAIFDCCRSSASLFAPTLEHFDTDLPPQSNISGDVT
jgi:ArsR family transcriptional regulator